MKSRDELQNDYEEALFAIIMDDIMELEGRALLEERRRLSESDEFKVPDDVNDRCIAFIDRLFEEANAKRKAARVRKIWRTLLVAALIMSIFTTSVCAIVPEVKEKIVSFFTKITEQIVHFSVLPIIDENIMDGKYYFADVFREYELIDSGNDEYSAWEIYESKETNDSQIYLITSYGFESTITVYDYEDCIFEEISIGDFEGGLLYKDDRWQAALYDRKHNNFLDVVFVNVDKNKVLDILRVIHYK